MKINQNDRILVYLKLGYSLTGLEALEFFGSMKLATRIGEIKRENPGLDIRDEFVRKNGKQFKKYWIFKPEAPKDMFLGDDGALLHEWSKK